jgi:hypothetical protein
LLKALEFDPNFPYGHTFLGWTQAQKGMLDDGVAQASRGARDGGSPVQFSILGVLEVMAGQRAAANRVLDQLWKQKTKTYICAHEIAGVQAALGQKESALDSLDLAYQERSDCMPFLRFEPAMTPLRSEPRFQALVRLIEQ